MNNLAHNLKLRYLTFALLFGVVFTAFAQVPGIPYQAYFTTQMDVPGEAVEVPLANTEVLVEFIVRDENGDEEYREHILVTTDKYGLASTVVGVGNGTVQGTKAFGEIVWDNKKKTLDVGIDFSNSEIFDSHDTMEIVNIPSSSLAIGITTGVGAPHATFPLNPVPGDVYVDESTGEMYSHDGTAWVSVGGTGSGTGVPIVDPINPPEAGDIYVDENTGDVYSYNAITNTWENQSDVVSTDADNLVKEGTDGLAFLDLDIIEKAIGLTSGVGAPNASVPAGANPGDVYVDEATGDMYTFDGTEWVSVGGASTGTGAPTLTDPANPTGGDIYVDETTGDLYTYNSTTNTWENQSDVVSTDADNLVKEGTDGLAFLDLDIIEKAIGLTSGVGAPNASNPASANPGDVYVDEATGDMYTFDGTEWVSVGGASTGTGAPTLIDPANPTGGDIYVDETTGDLYTYNSTTNTWENQSDVVSADADNLVKEGTDGLAFLDLDIIEKAIGLTSGVGAPNASNPAGANPGDVYVDEATGDMYTFDGTEWVSVGGASTGTGAPTLIDPANPTGGDIYVDETTGDLYTYNSTTNTWENQTEALADNGLSVNSQNKVQLGGNLIKATTITADATNTLAVAGLEAPGSSDDYDIVTVDNSTGVLTKISVGSVLDVKRYVQEYTASDGDTRFVVPQTIAGTKDLDNIDVYRNGARIDFNQIDATTIELDLGSLSGCYAGDEIRIVQLQ